MKGNVLRQNVRNSTESICRRHCTRSVAIQITFYPYYYYYNVVWLLIWINCSLVWKLNKSEFSASSSSSSRPPVYIIYLHPPTHYRRLSVGYLTERRRNRSSLIIRDPTDCALVLLLLYNIGTRARYESANNANTFAGQTCFVSNYPTKRTTTITIR